MDEEIGLERWFAQDSTSGGTAKSKIRFFEFRIHAVNYFNSAHEKCSD